MAVCRPRILYYEFHHKKSLFTIHILFWIGFRVEILLEMVMSHFWFHGSYTQFGDDNERARHHFRNSKFHFLLNHYYD